MLKNQPQHNLLKSTIVVVAATTISKLAGFAREMVLAAFWGASSTSDAFLLAFTIPDTLLLMISTSVAACYISMYYRVESKTKFTRGIMTFLIIIGLAFSVIFTAVPQALVRLFAIRIGTETFELATYFLRYMVWSAVFILLMDIFSAQLEIHGNFLSAGIRTIWRNAAVILGIILGATSGHYIFVAIAPIVGSALCVFSLAFACRKHGYTYRPELDLRSQELKQVLIMLGPMFLSTAAGEINAIVGKNLAASLSTGILSTFNYSSKTIGIFAALIGFPLSTVLFPHLSKLASDGDTPEIKSILTNGIVYLTAILLPVCVGIAILSQPIVRILFQRGAFTVTDTIVTAECLRIHAAVVLMGSLNPLLMRGFYTMQNTKIPANSSIASVAVNIAASVLLIGPLGYRGLAYASTLSSASTTLLLLIFLRKRYGHLKLREKFPEFAKIALSSTIMGAGVWFAASRLPLMTASTFQSMILCGAIVFAAFILYVILLSLMKSKTVAKLSEILMKYKKGKRAT